MMQEQQQPTFGSDSRDGLNSLCLVLNAHAMCLIPFLRYGFGRNVPGFSGVLAFILLFMTVGASADVGMLWFTGAWILALILQRIKAYSLIRRGMYFHSEYRGWPWLTRILPFNKTEKAAKDVEPLICFAIGALLLPVSATLGCFIGSGVVSLTILHCMEQAIHQKQVTSMRDLQIEQQALSQSLRSSR